MPALFHQRGSTRLVLLLFVLVVLLVALPRLWLNRTEPPSSPSGSPESVAVSPRSDGALPPDIRSSRRALVARAPTLPSSQLAQTMQAVHQLIEQGVMIRPHQRGRRPVVYWRNLWAVRLLTLPLESLEGCHE